MRGAGGRAETGGGGGGGGGSGDVPGCAAGPCGGGGRCWGRGGSGAEDCGRISPERADCGLNNFLHVRSPNRMGADKVEETRNSQTLVYSVALH